MNKNNIKKIAATAVVATMVTQNIQTVFAVNGEVLNQTKEDIVKEEQVNDDNITDINIYHTNDTHSRAESSDSRIGFAKFKEYIDETSQDVDGKLVLDAGDTFHGQAFATLENGESIAKIIKAVGYDALTPGNHDFNYGQDKLNDLGEMAGVEVLAANVTDASGELKYSDSITKEIGDVKVGVFGIATPESAYKTNPTNVEGLDFGTKEEVIEDAQNMVDKLEQEGCDVIVGLAHVGIDADSELKSTDIATNVEGMDLLIDAHSHHELKDYPQSTNTVMTSTGEYFESIGHVSIQYNETTDEVTVTPQQITAEEIKDLKEDEEVKSLIYGIKEGQEVILNEVIGNTPIALDGERSSVRFGHTNLGNLITNSMLYETGADIALTNGGGIRASIDEGDITKGEVLTVLPFGNYIVTLEVTGQQVIDALNHGLVVGAGSFTHFAGMEVEVKEVIDGETTRLEVVSTKIDGKKIKNKEKYTVATNDFLAVGGDNYTMLAEGTPLNEFASLDEALIKYIGEEGEKAIEDANNAQYLTYKKVGKR